MDKWEEFYLVDEDNINKFRNCSFRWHPDNMTESVTFSAKRLTVDAALEYCDFIRDVLTEIKDGKIKR